MSDDMIILTKTFDLLAWLGPRAEKFPKVHRYTVSERLMNAALDFQETIFDAQSQGGTTRQKLLRAADSHLNKLRLYLRLAHRWKWLNDGQYRHVSEMVAEIGRMLGSWIKAS
ncbi:MAG: diversity-generating retroelement protein Avd [Blastocatellia bacterium]